jgi:hypothetical protein
MKQLYTLLILLIPFVGFGQLGEFTYGGFDNEGFRDFEKTSDGGYAVIGNTYSMNGTSVVYLLKIDEEANEEWFQTFDNLCCEGNSLLQYSDDGYFITGFKNGIYDTPNTSLLIKTDYAGNPEFGTEPISSSPPSSQAEKTYSIQKTLDGGVAYINRRISDNGIELHEYLIKADYSDNSNNLNLSIDPDWDIYSFESTSDSGFIMSGYRYQGSALLLYKTDKYGVEEWSSTIQSTVADEYLYLANFNNIQQTTDGGYILIGSRDITSMQIPTHKNIFLHKTDQYGTTQWTQNYGGELNDFGYSVKEDVDGGFVLIGTYQTNDMMNKPFLVKTNEIGEEQWSRIYGQNDSTSEYGAYSIKINSNGGYIIGGNKTTQNNSDIFMIFTDSNGDTVSLQNSWNCVSNSCVDPMDGTGIYSSLNVCEQECQSVSSIIENNFDVNIFPNPSSNIFNLEFDLDSKAEILVTNVLGEQVYVESTNSVEEFNTQIDLSNYSKGIYNLTIKTSDSISNHKLILQ